MDNIDLYTEHMNSLLMKTGKQKFRDIENSSETCNKHMVQTHLKL